MDERIYEHPGKCYLHVWASFDEAGQVKPLAFEWEGRRVAVDRVLDVRPGASRKAGGSGMRYLCRVRSHRISLYLEEQRWFVEREEIERLAGGG